MPTAARGHHATRWHWLIGALRATAAPATQCTFSMPVAARSHHTGAPQDVVRTSQVLRERPVSETVGGLPCRLRSRGSCAPSGGSHLCRVRGFSISFCPVQRSRGRLPVAARIDSQTNRLAGQIHTPGSAFTPAAKIALTIPIAAGGMHTARPAGIELASIVLVESPIPATRRRGRQAYRRCRRCRRCRCRVLNWRGV